MILKVSFLEAYKHNFPDYPPHTREALAMIAALTKEEVDNFNSPDNEKGEGLMAAMMGPLKIIKRHLSLDQA